MSLTKQYFKYVSQNIFGLLGTSCYILADTYFISQAAGTSGVALLNLCLPIYNFIFAIGSMLGLGAATRYAILRAFNFFVVEHAARMNMKKRKKKILRPACNSRSLPFGCILHFTIDVYKRQR